MAVFLTHSHGTLSQSPTSLRHQTFNSPIPIINCNPIFSSITKPPPSLPRLRICRRKAVSQHPSYRLLAVSALLDGNSEAYSEEEPKNPNLDAAAVDIKLPRRSLLVQFTCDECGERSQRLINRLAYERGLVFVQCAGCERYHKLADNLGLVVEYDLREETDGRKLNTDQV